MRPREVIAGLAAAASPLRARAQQPAKVALIGCLSTGWHDGASSRNLALFRHELRTLGYAEGRNVAFEHRFAEGHFDRLPKLASELVALKPDVILAWPTPAAIAARKATQTIPIVMVNAGDPEGLGLVASLARPGGNVRVLPTVSGSKR